MPKLNMNHPEVADYMLAVAKHWIREAGIDGWRLDVANEVHPLFWSRFRRELKDEFPELLLIGKSCMRQSMVKGVTSLMAG